MGEEIYSYHFYDAEEAEIEVVDSARGDGKFRVTGDQDPLEKGASRRAVVSIHRQQMQHYLLHLVRTFDDKMFPVWERWLRNIVIHARGTTDSLTGGGISEWDEEFDDDQVTLAPNIIRPILDQRAAVISSVPTVNKLVAKSDETTNEWAARGGHAVMRQHDAADDVDYLKRLLLKYSATCSGVGVVKTFYDASAGPFLGRVAQGREMYSHYEGRARRVVIPTWHFGWDLAAQYGSRKVLENARFTFHRRRLTRSMLTSMFTPAEMKLIMERRVRTHHRRHWLDAVEQMDNALYTTQGVDYSETSGQYEVIEFHHHRDDRFPLGVMGFMVDGVLLRPGPLPYAELDDDRILDFPFSIFLEDANPPGLLGVAPMDLSADLQLGHNESMSARANDEIFASQRILVATGTDRVEHNLTNSRNLILTLPGAGASLAQLDRRPPGHNDFALADKCFTQMQHQNNIHPGTLGAQQKGATAREVQINLNSDQLNAVPVAKDLAACMADAATKDLRIIQLEYTLPRMVDVVSDASYSPHLQYFTGSDLSPIAEVRVEVMEDLPAGPEARANLIRYLQELEVTLPPEPGEEPLVTRRMIRSSIFKLAHSLDSHGEQMQRNAEREAHEMLTMDGMEPMMLPGLRGHQIRVKVWMDLFESELFREAEPHRQQVFLEKVEERREAIAVLMAPIAELPGGEGEEGGQGNPGSQGSPSPVAETG